MAGARQRVPAALSRPSEGGGWFGRPTAVLLGLLIAAALFAVLFPWFPGGTQLREGDSSPWTLAAPRDLSFDSIVLTQEARDEADPLRAPARLHRLVGRDGPHGPQGDRRGTESPVALR